MKFKTKEEISAPVEHVFEKVSDVDTFEKALEKRGGKVVRSPSSNIAEGTTWDAQVTFRGAQRNVTMVLEEYVENEKMLFKGGSSGMDIFVTVDTVALSPSKTQLVIESEAKPKTLAARLLVQSAKLARNKMETRYKTTVGNYARKVEASYAG